MDSNGKYTVTLLTTSAAYRSTLWSRIKFDHVLDDKLNQNRLFATIFGTLITICVVCTLELRIFALRCVCSTRNATNKTLALRCVALFVETALKSVVSTSTNPMWPSDVPPATWSEAKPVRDWKSHRLDKK